MRFVLASASERRRELIKKLNISAEVIVSNFDEESVVFEGSISDYVMKLSKGKADNVKNKLDEISEESYIVIGCDTIVSVDGMIMGKPKDEEHAFCMLKTLSGRSHKVYSGITVIGSNGKCLSDFECTEVDFSEVDDETIRWYISTGEPLDKAGAYGIQGYAGAFVKAINGCYYNIVGLPLNKLGIMLKEMGVNLYSEEG